MAKVYRVGSLYGTAYFNTFKEASRCKPGGEEPETFECPDAAAECNELLKREYDAEQTVDTLRMLLANLVDVCTNETIRTTDAGRRALKFLDDHPLPPVSSDSRDGGRSYGV